MSGLSQETFNDLNAFRQANGVAPLAYSSSEQSRANAQAEYNARTETNTHDVDQISYKGNADSTANGFIQAGANSSGHRANMLDSEYTQGAVSVYKDSNGHYYVVGSFYLEW
uniref:CAP domain-containing protein n=2 Tax=Paraclostridium sordellii TaxID=1505 RepID=A0A2I6SVZ9_PARSO|nr:CAP domain-containing protein [Paeniclostridium sordellii]AUO31713.1 CAP domain-containing protein [Paeniclostridium sordellii]